MSIPRGQNVKDLQVVPLVWQTGQPRWQRSAL